MATKNFKGFQLVALATFSGATKDKDTLYFVRTNEAKTDGFLYFNGKKYGTAEDVKEALTKKYGELGGKTISDYVAGEIKKVTEAATTLEGKVTANTKAIEIINGIGEGSISKAVSDAKDSLVGGATDGYKTLGDLEDKIKAEASTARAEEKKNADAAAAAQAAAEQAQTTADAKVASVGVEGAIVKSGTDTAPTIGLKLAETQGNVVLSQENGLKAEIDLSAFGVKGVAEGEKVISVSTNGLLSSTLKLKYDSVAKKINLYGKAEDETNLISSIDATDFIKDGMLEKAELKVFETEIDATHPAGTYIVLTWNTDGPKTPMYINVTSLIDVYTAGNGLSLNDHEFSVNFDVAATKASVDAVAGKVSTLEGKVATIEGDGEGSIKKAVADEASRAQAAEKKNADAIAILNGIDTVPGSVDQKIKTALEAGAVTLEVKDNDAYLGVSATTGANGTVYTLASKADKINEAIKAEADKVKVSVTNGTYVKGSVDEATGRVITLSEKVQAVADADANVAEKKGLAEASDVKAYVDGKVSDKNVAAEGESGDTALVSASASGNKVTVAATQKLKDAVAKAESSVQSVNGKTGSTVTLTGADIATNQEVSGSTNATVNAVLADIYSKIGAVKVSSQEKTITVDEETGRIIDVHRQTVTAAQEAGHVALECGNDGALYGVMYYSGDDVDAQ